MESNFPPGVTGNEYAIAGSNYEKESDELCPAILWYGSECQAPTMEEGYEDKRWLVCDGGHKTDLETLDPRDDPDRKYDEERDRRMLGIDMPDEVTE